MQAELLVTAACRWTDVFEPSPPELELVAEGHQLHPILVQDCLDPVHLPKYQKLDGGLFVMVRAFDSTAPKDAVSVEEMTHKVAIFVREGALLTIHRSPMAFVGELERELKEEGSAEPAFHLMIHLCKRATLTFETPLEQAETEIERLEAAVLASNPSPQTLVDLHTVRRRLSCLKRLFWHTLQVFQRLPNPPGEASILLQDLKETIESLMFFSDELLEDCTSLMNLELSIASQRTNQVIRVLTLFSVFFLPLTFIVGVYGMNFEVMPELRWRWGYPATWAVMIAMTAGIALWFKRRGWLKG